MTERRRPGWYGDPDDSTMLRYYDGSVWTENRAPQGTKPARPQTARAEQPASAWIPPSGDEVNATNEPGWKVDPSNTARRRYWNGRKFTGYTADATGPFPQIPPNHRTASPTLWERFQRLGRLEKLAIAAVAVLVVIALPVLAALSDESEADRPGEGPLGAAAVSQYGYDLTTDEFFEACGDYASDPDGFARAVASASRPVGSARVQPIAADVDAWYGTACD